MSEASVHSAGAQSTIPAGQPVRMAAPWPTVVAVATSNPLAVSTFSGYSHHLFTAIQQIGVAIVPLSSRRLRPQDVLSGAISPRGLLAPAAKRRQNPRIRPDWYWSMAGFERFSRRFDASLVRLPEHDIVLQIGTHVRTSVPGVASYCVTDATVVQALEAGEFSVSRAGSRVAEEAIAAQAEVFFSCEKVFTLSRWAARSVVDDYGVPQDRVTVIGAGANLSQDAPRRVDPQQPVILFVGMDWEQKGGPLLLDAFRLARRQVPGARLVVVGCAPDIAEEGVEVVGYIDRSEIRGHRRLLELYASASCFSILSRFDAFPNVLLEAAMLGVPVVTTADGSRAEVVEHGVTGLLVGSRDPEAVALALVAVLQDPALAAAMGEQARASARSRFSWDAVAHHVLAEMGLSTA